MVWAVGFLLALAASAGVDKSAPSFILGGQIADAARVAEKSVNKSSGALESAVTTAAQRVITISGQKPTVVQGALETVLAECASKPAVSVSSSYLCPTTPEAHVAIEKLLVVVRRLASLELAPGAGSGNGIGALAAPPTGGGGADYRSTRN